MPHGEFSSFQHAKHTVPNGHMSMLFSYFGPYGYTLYYIGLEASHRIEPINFRLPLFIIIW